MKKLLLLPLVFLAFFLASCEDNPLTSNNTTWSINFASNPDVYAASADFTVDTEGNFYTSPIEFRYFNPKVQYYHYRLRGQIVYSGTDGEITDAQILDSTGTVTIGTFNGFTSGNNGSGTWQITSGVTGSGTFTLVRRQ